ncbi:hypothetical protein BKA70DRAFT_1576429 [Coprinopsis sp. MPI-PUGE-AT-0042]|nr:hypothetical protein BKA70DRAFT_1576429 [Coprinopsis sp. MPI-PUGE-AT-0042]
MVDLPPELRSEIVEILGDDTSSLESLTLVDSYWGSPARKLLFQSVYISGHSDPEEQCGAFLQISQARPSILALVKTISFTDATSLLRPRSGAKHEGWLMRPTPTVIQVLSLLSSIHTVVLQGKGSGSERIYWGSVSPGFKAAFFDMCGRAETREIELADIVAFPLAPFIRFHHLGHISLKRINHPSTDLFELPSLNDGPEMQIEAPYPLDPRGAFQPLPKLSLSSSPRAWIELVNAFKTAQQQAPDPGKAPLLDLLQVKDLWLETSQPSINARPEEIALEEQYWQTIHNSSAMNVQGLHIKHSYTPLQESPLEVLAPGSLSSLPGVPRIPPPGIAHHMSRIFDLSPYKALTTLHLFLRPVISDLTEKGSETENALIRGLVQLANQSPPTPLQTIHLELSLTGPFVITPRPNFKPIDKYMSTERLISRMDQVLGDPSSFGNLRQVKVTVNVLVHVNNPLQAEADLKREVEGRFARLGPHSRDILSIAVAFKRQWGKA